MVQNNDLKLIIDKTSTTKNDTLRTNTPKYIILHSTQNYSTFELLYNLHVKKYQWNGVGYHIFISKDNAYKAREYALEGAHCLGLNFSSIGICVYSNNHNPGINDLNITKKIIEDIRVQYGPLQVLSHTLAQLRYIKKLSDKKGFKLDVQDKIELCSNAEFLDIAKQVHNFSERNNLKKYNYLESLIKSFKNCPGEEFYEFINELNKND